MIIFENFIKDHPKEVFTKEEVLYFYKKLKEDSINTNPNFKEHLTTDNLYTTQNGYKITYDNFIESEHDITCNGSHI